MKILVTGSSGHLGEALVRTLRKAHDVVGLDALASPHTLARGSLVDRAFVREHVQGSHAIIHTATLHKPHVATHTKQAFIDTNVTGTLNLLEEAALAGCKTFLFTSTTSTFGRALEPAAGEPAAWITEDVRPIPKNIYGVTKTAAEDLCELFHLQHGLDCIVLRTSRFFPEEDDDASVRTEYADDNMKVNELLYRRVDIEDVVTAHQAALERAATIGFGRYIISATTPFTQDDLGALRRDAPSVVARYAPSYPSVYARRGWRMYPSIGRVYVNARARADLGWQPKYDFARAIAALEGGNSFGSDLAREVGSKGYHRC